MRVVAGLAGRFVRAPGARAAPIALALTGLLLMVSFTTLSALGLSAVQITDRELRTFDGSVQVQTPMREDDAAVVAGSEALDAAGASEVAWALESLDFRVTGGDGAVVRYEEAEWPSTSLASRYDLASGRWPASAGEVVVSSTMARNVTGGRLVTMSGRTSFEVVGVAADRYATRANVVLGAPGTWAGQDWESLSAAFPDAAATATLYWTGASSDAAVDAVIRATGADDEQAAAMRLSARDRHEMVHQATGALTSAYPLAYTVPAIVLPVVMGLAVMLGGDRRARRTLGILRMVGVRSREATTALWSATVAAALLAAVAGVAAGTVLSLAGRPLLQRLASQPLSPFEWPTVAAAQFVALVLLTTVVFIVATTIRQRRARAATLVSFQRPARSLGFVRHLAIAVAVVALVWIASSMRTLFDMVTATVVCIAIAALVAPSVIRGALPLLRDARPQHRLARRHMEDGSRRVSVSTTLIVVTTAPALAMLVLLASVQATSLAQRSADVPLDQVQIATSSTFERPPEAVVALVRDVAPTAREVQLHSLGSPDAPVRAREDGLGLVFALDTVADAEAMCGPLPAAARTALHEGGLLTLGGSGAVATDRLWSGPSDSTDQMPSAAFECPGWQGSISALTLLSTANEKSLPESAGPVVLVGVSAAQARMAVQSLEEHGYPVSLLRFDARQDAPAVPPAPMVAIVVTCLLAGIAIASTGRAHARALREIEPGLWALGLPKRWTQGVLHTQLAVVGVAGTALAVASVGIPAAITSAMLPDVVLAVPWGPLGAAIVVVLAPVVVRYAADRSGTARTRRQST